MLGTPWLSETHGEQKETKRTARKTDKRRRKHLVNNSTEEVSEETSTMDTTWDQAALLKLKKTQLQYVASSLGLPKTTTKAELVEKILEKSPAVEISIEKGSKHIDVFNGASIPQAMDSASELPIPRINYSFGCCNGP